MGAIVPLASYCKGGTYAWARIVSVETKPIYLAMVHAEGVWNLQVLFTKLANLILQSTSAICTTLEHKEKITKTSLLV